MKLKVWGTLAAIFTAISAACFLRMNYEYKHITLLLWVTFFSTICAAVSLLVFGIGIAVGRKKTKHGAGIAVSTVFCIVMLLVCIGTVLWAVYDMHTDSGIMAGIKGYLALLFLVPAESLAFLIAGGVSIVLRKKEKQKDAAGKKQENENRN